MRTEIDETLEQLRAKESQAKNANEDYTKEIDFAIAYYLM
jgi:hypothetical protein